MFYTSGLWSAGTVFLLMHPFSKKSLFISLETKQLLICLTSYYIQWFCARHCSPGLIMMDVLHWGLPSPIPLNDRNISMQAIQPSKCIKVFPCVPPLFDVKTPPFLCIYLKVFTHTWLSVFSLFYDLTHLFKVSVKTRSAQGEIPVCSLLLSYVTLFVFVFLLCAQL